jgi:hypothetical protein
MDQPWDFPPGSPGSRHSGSPGGSEAPRDWRDRIAGVYEDYELAFQPTLNVWVVWRYRDFSWVCVHPLWNPNNEQPFVELPERFLTWLRLVDPRWLKTRSERRAEASRLREAQGREEAGRLNDMLDDAWDTARLHTTMGTHGKAKAHRVGGGFGDPREH